MKIIFCFLSVAIALLASIHPNDAKDVCPVGVYHDQTWWAPIRVKEKLLFTERTRASGKFWNWVYATTTWPKDGSSSDSIITRIEVIDYIANSSGGCTQLVSGGIGHDRVTMERTSNWDSALDFVVKIYGHKK